MHFIVSSLHCPSLGRKGKERPADGVDRCDRRKFSRHIVPGPSSGHPRRPPTTAAVTAPIEIPVTATGVNPGRFS